MSTRCSTAGATARPFCREPREGAHRRRSLRHFASVRPRLRSGARRGRCPQEGGTSAPRACRPEADARKRVPRGAPSAPMSACAGGAGGAQGSAWRSGRRCSWPPAAWPGARPPCSSRPWRWGSPARAGTRSRAWSSRRRGRGPRAPGPASGTPTGTGAGPAGGVGAHRDGRTVGVPLAPCRCGRFRTGQARVPRALGSCRDARRPSLCEPRLPRLSQTVVLRKEYRDARTVVRWTEVVSFSSRLLSVPSWFPFRYL